jgi:RHS repeat-associated protein
VENRVISVSGGASFVYDGDGNRVKKTENGETILYVNQFYEKNLTTGVVTTYYYLDGKLVAMREGTDLKYTHQDHLTSTSVMTDSSGDSLGAIKYLPFGECRNSPPYPTDILFTGQRLDETGLYYYGARYYDATIGRFISADTIIPNPANPQSYNRYSYCLNNPLKYIDPSGRWNRAAQERYYQQTLEENGIDDPNVVALGLGSGGEVVTVIKKLVDYKPPPFMFTGSKGADIADFPVTGHIVIYQEGDNLLIWWDIIVDSLGRGTYGTDLKLTPMLPEIDYLTNKFERLYEELYAMRCTEKLNEGKVGRYGVTYSTGWVEMANPQEYVFMFLTQRFTLWSSNNDPTSSPYHFLDPVGLSVTIIWRLDYPPQYPPFPPPER